MKRKADKKQIHKNKTFRNIKTGAVRCPNCDDMTLTYKPTKRTWQCLSCGFMERL